MDENTTGGRRAMRASGAPRVPFGAISLILILAAALYIAMASSTGLAAFGKTLSFMSAVQWTELVILSIVSYLLRFMRWHRFMHALGHRIPVIHNLEIYLAGFALTLTPGKAGESIRSLYLYPHGVPFSRSISALVAERLLDLIAVGSLACLAAFVFPERGVWIVTALSACVALLLFFRTRLMTLLVMRIAKGRAGDFMSEAGATLRFLFSGLRLAEALSLSILAWTLQGISLFLIANSLGYQFSAYEVIGIYCLSILAGAASFIPGGLGATEIAISLLLTSAGMQSADAVAASLLSRGVTLWLAVAIGFAASVKLALRNRAKLNAGI
jgi:uncharacterized membrane protein YbhN (UPF0104 family)